MTSKSNIFFNRIYVFVIGLILFWILIEIRLFIIQIERNDFYVELSQNQSAKKIKLKAKRGEIFDRTGECLATNIIHYDFGVDLKLVKNKDQIARACATAFKRSANYYLKKMNTGRDFVYLARKVSESKVESLLSISDPGLVKIKGYKRYYSFGKYGSQVIGLTDVDDNGISGLESQHDKDLSGIDGWTFLMADAKRRFGYNVDYPNKQPDSGVNLVLTLNKNYQTIVEDELDTAIKQYNANYGMAVLMEPNSGEILAMYTSPGFDLNRPFLSSVSQRKNRAITDIFEPGSIFKIFPAAALLQEKIKKPDDIVYCHNGSYTFYNHTIHDTKKYAWLSFKKVIENSSNIGMVKLTEDISRNKLYKYLKNFGFDSHTGVNLIGESDGMLKKPEKFSGLSKAVISFGQEVGVTALQITNAFASVVNGGHLMRPYVLKQILSSGGDIVEEHKPMVIRDVISTSVSQTLNSFMLDAVKKGTGKKAAIDGVMVGGKTGTAQKFNKKTNRYKKNSYLASFVGFAPYEKPEFVLGIFIDEPKPRYYGGEVAAPIFANIMQRLLNYASTEQIHMKYEPKIVQKNKSMPDFSGLSINAIEEYFHINNIAYHLEGEGSHVVSQKKEMNKVQLFLATPEIENGEFPNLKGLSLREALSKIDFSKCTVTITGQGNVVNQSIRPGSKLNQKTSLVLSCSTN
jgi:cell division protein FtsI (penicillin-binding protein 3)